MFSDKVLKLDYEINWLFGTSSLNELFSEKMLNKMSFVVVVSIFFSQYLQHWATRKELV